MLSQDILYEIKSFPQGNVKVKSTLYENAYNILNFGFMFHIYYIARCIPANGYSYDETIKFNAASLSRLPSGIEYQAVKYEV